MRITNKIMQQNTLSNINTNKVNLDRLSQQESSQKKVGRPSDDPVVAIRALRLRSNVTEVTQYYSKNIPDAQSWLEVTEDALVNLSAVLTNLISRCNKGANSYLETEDRQILLKEMKALAEEIYATGDADYAGRYVFTGFRTNTSLSFTEEQNMLYEITEQLDISAIDSVTKVDTSDLLNINSSNYMDEDMDITELDINSVECHRIRLAYNDCVGDDSAAPSIIFKRQKVDANGVPVITDGKPDYEEVVWSVDPRSEHQITIMHSYEDPYAFIADENNMDAIVYVPETGELLLGENSYTKLMAVKDDASTSGVNEGEIRVTYQKEHWEKGDLRPEHYFACTSNPGKANEIKYNPDYLNGTKDRQSVEYDVGFNQRIRINSTADQCFEHGIGREVDDIMSAMQNVMDLEAAVTNITKLMSDAEGNEEATARLQQQLDAVKKALTLAKDKEQKLFQAGISAFQGYLDDTNLCVTECGTRSSKLSLIENRMQTQKTTFETLKSTNEDVDIAEIEIYMQSATVVYEAALLAAGKIMQNTLLNFI